MSVFGINGLELVIILLVAMLVMIVATATTWRARATDLAALRTAALTSRAVRRAPAPGDRPGVALAGGGRPE